MYKADVDSLAESKKKLAWLHPKHIKLHTYQHLQGLSVNNNMVLWGSNYPDRQPSAVAVCIFLK